MVEHTAVNRADGGSNPPRGKIRSSLVASGFHSSVVSGSNTDSLFKRRSSMLNHLIENQRIEVRFFSPTAA